jgi:S-adenosylmethionine:tRNA ribosyltransferase-isomerase
MTQVSEIRISDYTYDLPEERIAVYPLSERDQSRLLVWRGGAITETLFSQADRMVPAGSLLVFNNTRVIHARLIFHTTTGARIEIFCLEPHDPTDYNLSFQSTTPIEWKCLVGNARKWKRGALTMEVPTGQEMVTLQAEMTGRSGNAFLIRFTWNRNVSFATLIEAAGEMPIPPYLNREAEAIDDDRYQTTYARIDGSVAAPTAGLHFTEEVLQKMKSHHIATAELTLHVGAGTFQPVKSERVAEHDMHTETVYVTREFLEKLMLHEGRVIAVGTTSVRSLESLYWLGAALSESPESSGIPDTPSNELPFHVGQWQPYTTAPDLSPAESMGCLLKWMEEHHAPHIAFTTSIIIVPGYRFRMISGMFTNFHQPRSTLLLLIAAFLGPGWREIYDYALHHGFRFLSYGDSNLYLK